MYPIMPMAQKSNDEVFARHGKAEIFVCFGWTEAEWGGPQELKTTAERRRHWFSMAPKWDHERQRRISRGLARPTRHPGFIVEKDRSWRSEIHKKMSCVIGEIGWSSTCAVPEANRLPNVKGLKVRRMPDPGPVGITGVQLWAQHA